MGVERFVELVDAAARLADLIAGAVGEPYQASQAMNMRCMAGVQPLTLVNWRGTGVKSSKAAISGSVASSAKVGVWVSLIGQGKAQKAE